MLRALATALLASSLAAGPAPAAPPGLPADWSLVKEFPAIPHPDGGTAASAERLTLRVEMGWLVVRLDGADGAPQWHVVLARATNPTPPAVEADPKFRGLSVQYGPYFVRENSGRLRIYRERKTADAPAWPAPESDPAEQPSGHAFNLRMTETGGWLWLTAGAVADKPDVRIRFQSAALRDGGHGAQGFPGGLGYLFCGDEAKCFDEGDLLTGYRIPPYVAEAVLRGRRLKAELPTKPAPALDAAGWLNAPAPLALDALKGKVVLLDFWGTWCAPCVRKLPATQALHEKYKERGLVVIGVHSAEGQEGLGDFVKQKGLTFPVCADSGKTAARYLVGSWPTYVLIDKSGKVAGDFSNELPSADRVEKLLGAGANP